MPTAFKNIVLNTLPVLCKNQKSAWMNVILFKNLFFQEFVPEVERFFAKEWVPKESQSLLHPLLTEISIIRNDLGPCHSGYPSLCCT